jgi:hypothetical protein
MLVWSAQCEIDQEKASCERLREYDVDHGERVWLAYLVTRRDVYIIPTVNCLGYIKNDRMDAGIDPNRDFAYIRQDDNCFQSSTANIVLELFRKAIIQVLGLSAKSFNIIQ